MVLKMKKNQAALTRKLYNNLSWALLPLYNHPLFPISAIICFLFCWESISYTSSVITTQRDLSNIPAPQSLQ
jgi:hypothetical protein